MKLYGLRADDPSELGPYRLLRRIATGGMGRVYLARRAPVAPGGTAVARPLAAVKTLLAEGGVSDADRARFAREVELAARVDSRYTAAALDADPGAERPWLATEFVPAPSLTALVRGAGPLPPEGVRRVAAGVVWALLELHTAGVVHRDIKPLNILLPHDGPRLLDFGISHAHDRGTVTTTTIGTFEFTSPEQAAGRPSCPASDMYALGTTLFFLATGRPPYGPTDSSLATLALVQRAEVDTAGLPPALEPLVLPLLAAEPGARPGPGALLAGALAGVPAPAEHQGEWLPTGWTALISEYAAQGRELAAGAVDFEAADAPTRAHPGALTPAERDRAEAPTCATPVVKPEPRARARAGARARPERKAAAGLAALLCCLALLVAGLLELHPWRTVAALARGTAPSPAVSSPYANPAPYPKPRTGDDDRKDPDPDPAAEAAFRSVSVGDCLDAVDTGRKGATRVDWSRPTPRTAPCAPGTRVKVTGRTSTPGGCPSGVGRSSMAYDGRRPTELCLAGVYHRGDCLLAEQDGNSLRNIAMLTAPTCTDRRPPAPYNTVLTISDIYRAIAGVSTGICRHGDSDPYTYWSTRVDAGATLLCLRAAG